MTERFSFSAAVALLLCSVVASNFAVAQDAVEVDPAHHKIEFENAQVRVLRIAFAPGEISVMHDHPCLIAIGLTDSTLTFHLPDGSTRNAAIKRGQVIVAKPTKHQPENQTDEASQVIVVELKSSDCENNKREAHASENVGTLGHTIDKRH